jgi:Cdc6-like AAA superfamily ATPase
MFLTLIESRSNIFMHGPNGTGKTTFAQDCFRAVRTKIPCIYVDTIEFYSEKLISIAVSQQLHGILQQHAQAIKLPKALRRKMVFKVCKSLSLLLEALLALQVTLGQLKETHKAQFPQTELLDLHFYMVFDNIKSLLKIERTKKIMEKLSITQSLIDSPSLFSICVINDSLTDEIQVFREHTNVFQEYMYTYFYFEPTNASQLKAILWESMSQAYGGQCAFLIRVYDNYFGQLYQFF